MGTAALDEPVEAEGDGTALVPWSGPIDVETVSSYERRLDPYLQMPQAEIRLDFRRVDYIDSAGLRFLLALRDRLAECRERIVLVVTGESRVERTLRLVGFDKLFQMVRAPVEAWRQRRDRPPPLPSTPRKQKGREA